MSTEVRIVSINDDDATNGEVSTYPTGVTAADIALVPIGSVDAAYARDLRDDVHDLQRCHRCRLTTWSAYAADRPSYPSGTTTSSSIVTLNRTKQGAAAADGKFLQLLSSSSLHHNGGGRGGGSSSSSSSGISTYNAAVGRGAVALPPPPNKLRLSIIPSSSPPVVIDFTSEKDYWFLISAVKRAIAGQDVKYHGKCVLPTNANGTRSSGAAANSFAGLVNGVAKELYGQACEVTGYRNVRGASPRLVIYDGTGGRGEASVAVSVDLSKVEALAVSADFEPPSSHVLVAWLRPLWTQQDGQSVVPPRLALSLDAAQLRSSAASGPSLAVPVAAAELDKGEMLDAAVTVIDGTVAAATVPVPWRALLSKWRNDRERGEVGIEIALPVHTLTAVAAAATPGPGPSTAAAGPVAVLLIRSASDLPLRAAVRPVDAVAPPSTVGKRMSALFRSLSSSSGAGTESSPAPAPPRVAGTRPTAYCTVALETADGQALPALRGTGLAATPAAWLLSKVRGDAAAGDRLLQTEAVPDSCDPEWNHTVQLDNVGVPGAARVVVRVWDRADDASASAPDLIVGEAAIPVDCFLQDEASLNLPLETQVAPSTPSNGYSAAATATTPTISVTTRLAYPAAARTTPEDDVASSPTAVDPISPPREQKRPFELCFELRPVAPECAWFPCQLLEGAAPRGDVFCGPDALLIRLAPDAGGVLTTAREGVRLASCLLVALPYSRVLCATELTCSVLLLTVAFDHVPSPSQAHGGASPPSAAAVPSTTDLLVAPCPATALHGVVRGRIDLLAVRTQLGRLRDSVHALHGPPCPCPGCSDRSSVARTASANASASAHVMTFARVLASVLLSLYEGAEQGMAAAADADADADAAVRARHANRYLRAKAYIGVLVALCHGHVAGPARQVSALVAEDLVAAQHAAEGGTEAARLRSLLDVLCWSGERRLYEACLCAAGKMRAAELLGAYLQAARQALAPFVGSGGADGIGQVGDRHTRNAVMLALVDYDAFFDAAARRVLALAGWTLASDTRLLIVDEAHFDRVLASYATGVVADVKAWLAKTLHGATALKSNVHRIPWDTHVADGGRAVSPLPEVLRGQLNVYLELCAQDRQALTDSGYSDGVSDEAMAALLHELKLMKSNRDHHDDDDDDGNRGARGRGATSLSRARATSLSLPGGAAFWTDIVDYTDGDEDEDDGDDGEKKKAASRPLHPAEAQRVARLQHLNDVVTRAVGASWLLLAEEYGRALQSKHWDLVDASQEEISANTHFLVAVANDCYRVATGHAEDIVCVATAVGTPPSATSAAAAVAHDVARAVADAFQRVSEAALKHAARVIFARVQPTLLAFEATWTSDPGNNAVREITGLLSSAFRTLRPMAEDIYYIRLLNICADTVACRLLLLLRERATKGTRFTVAECKRLEADVGVVNKTFSEAKMALHNGYMHNSLLSRQMQILFDTCDLLLLAAAADDGGDSSPLLALMRMLVRKYAFTTTWVDTTSSVTVAHNYLTCIAVLRPDAGAATVALVNKITGQASTAAAKANKGSAIGELKRRKSSTLSQRNGGGGNDDKDNDDEGGGPSPAVAFEDPVVRVFGTPVDYTAAATSSQAAAAALAAAGKQAPSFTHRASSLAAALVGSRQHADAHRAATLRALGLEDPRLADDGNDDPSSLPPPSADAAQTPIPAPAPMLASSSSSRWKLPSRSTSMIAASSAVMGARDWESRSDGRGSSIISASETPSASASQLEDILASGGNGNGNGSGGPPCTVRVSSLRVRGLTTSSFFGGPNPYVAITILNTRQKTKVKWGHREANWKAFFLDYTLPRAAVAAHRVAVRVFDKERVQRKRLLGAVNIRMAGIDAHPIEGWFALEGGECPGAEVYLCIELLAVVGAGAGAGTKGVPGVTAAHSRVGELGPVPHNPFAGYGSSRSRYDDDDDDDGDDDDDDNGNEEPPGK